MPNFLVCVMSISFNCLFGGTMKRFPDGRGGRSDQVPTE